MTLLPFANFDDPQFDFSKSVGFIVTAPSSLTSTYPLTTNDIERVNQYLTQNSEWAMIEAPQVVKSHISNKDIQVLRYQDGPPRAGQDGGPLTSLIVLINDISQIVTASSVALAVGRWVINQYRRMATQRTEYGTPYFSNAGTRLGLLPQSIRFACYENSIDRYGLDFDSTTSTAHTRDIWYGDARHPSTSMTITVQVHTKDHGTYVYLVGGQGLVLEHFLVKAEQMQMLQVPDSIENLHDPSNYSKPHELRPLIGGSVIVTTG